MNTTRKVKNSSDRRTAVGPTGTEKEVEYTSQNGGDSWFQELLNEFPTLRSQSNVVKRRLAEQHKKQEEKEKMKIWSSEFADAQLGSDFDSDYNTGMLGAEADWDGLYDDSLDTQDKLDIKGFLEDRIQPDHTLDQVAEEDYDTKMDDARESYLSNQHSAESSGMTNNAFGVGDSSLSEMSPNQKMAMVGLLKDFMSPAPDDPVPQIRGAGIIKGGGTPFPSLLAKKARTSTIRQ